MKRDDQRGRAPKTHEPLGVVDALAQLSFLVQGALEGVAAEHALSIVQTRLLGVLRDRSPNMNELARYLELDKSSVTGLVDRAERRGLVRRRPSSSDGRAVAVSVTPAGRKLIARAQARFEERVAALVQVLTEAERATLSALAGRVVVEDARQQGIDLMDVEPDPRG